MTVAERLGSDARAIAEEALAAVEPGVLVRRSLERDPLRTPSGGRLHAVAVGKAAGRMLDGALAAGVRPHTALVVTADGAPGPSAGGGAGSAPSVRLRQAGHPLPDPRSVAAARDVRARVQGADPDDRLLLLLSGGASALLALPAAGLTLGDLRSLTRLLLRSGAPVEELNTVRRHVEVLKGGGLALEAVPARIRALALSDVVGDPPHDIGSGPVSPDPTTFADAVRVLEDRRVWDVAPSAVRRHLLGGRAGELPDTPGPGHPCFEGVRWEVVGNASTVAGAAAEAAGRRGYRVRTLGTRVVGEARDVGRALARALLAERGDAAEAVCLVQAGETTVTVRGDGRGGRNQELALSAALELDGRPGALVLALGTDGVDGPTEAAGAWADGGTVAQARRRGIDAAAALDANDSAPFWRSLDQALVTGPTGTNVGDLMLALSAADSRGRSTA